MRTEEEIKVMIEVLNGFILDHGGPFGEGQEVNIGIRAGLQWVIDQWNTKELVVG